MMPTNAISATITAVILAGGRGSRMGGIDKGLQPLGGTPMALHALRRAQAQTGQAMVNANRNLIAYQSFGVPVWPDDNLDFEGPLSGFVVGLTHCQTPYLLTVPCDTPFFPLDLAGRLLAGLEAEGADMAMASQGGHTQPVFCLIKKEMLPSLMAFMQRGGRKIDAWTALERTTIVHFDKPSDDANAFANANTLEELLALAQD
jgi:molybdenum cofactor guanylyltransferase